MPTARDFADLAGKDRFCIVAQRDGVTVYATVQNMQGVFTDNIEFAYVYDAQDNREFKLRFWGAIAKMRGIDPATVQPLEVNPCAS